KIILCTNYEEAWSYFEKYEEYILGVITDNNFRRNGVRDPEAGLKLIRQIKERQKDIPILLQSRMKIMLIKPEKLALNFFIKVHQNFFTISVSLCLIISVLEILSSGYPMVLRLEELMIYFL